MQPYFLAKHAFVCAVGQDVIVLDLRNDKYLAFERSFWEPIVRRIGGWPSSDWVAPPDTEPDADALSQLIESGLLTANDGEGKDATPAVIELAAASMIENFRVQPPTIRAGHVFVFVTSIIATLLLLRFQSLEKIVGRIDRQRRRHNASPDLAKANDLVEVFRRLRPLLFTSRNHCLFESLTLFRFLSHYGIHPTWVFGVQTSPFAAHCWLQLGSTACNDALDHIRRYTPIMLV